MKYGYLIAVLAAGALMTACNGNKTTQENDTPVAMDELAEAQHNFDMARQNHSEIIIDKLAHLVPNNGLPVVVDFSATWCGPCQKMKPVFEELEDTYGDHVNFVTIDIDQHPELAESFGVSAVPTFIFIDKSGRESERLLGAASPDVLENQINKLLE